MKQQSSLFLLIFIIFVCDGVEKRCILPSSDGENYGICVKWSQCEIAQNLYINANIVPVYCQYDKDDPVVCCMVNKVSPDDIIPQQKRISAAICEERYFIDNQQIDSAPVVVLKRAVTFIGGIAAAPQEFPYMAALGWTNPDNPLDYEFLCGGALISRYFILTAAHCASVDGKSPVIVQIGGQPLNSTSAFRESIKKIYIHPEYSKKQSYHDIALLELKRAVNGGQFACLWQIDHIQYSSVTGIGYGDRTFGGTGSNDLIKGDLSLYSSDECKIHYPLGRRKIENGLIDKQLCAGDRNGIMDTCQGDSGGPLVIRVKIDNTKIVPYIVGITSFGQGCAGGPPSIYTRVSSYLDWIESIVFSNKSYYVL